MRQQFAFIEVVFRAMKNFSLENNKFPEQVVATFVQKGVM